MSVPNVSFDEHVIVPARFRVGVFEAVVFVAAVQEMRRLRVLLYVRHRAHKKSIKAVV